MPCKYNIRVGGSNVEVRRFFTLKHNCQTRRLTVEVWRVVTSGRKCEEKSSRVKVRRVITSEARGSRDDIEVEVLSRTKIMHRDYRVEFVSRSGIETKLVRYLFRPNFYLLTNIFIEFCVN